MRMTFYDSISFLISSLSVSEYLRMFANNALTQDRFHNWHDTTTRLCRGDPKVPFGYGSIVDMKERNTSQCGEEWGVDVDLVAMETI